MTDDWATAKAQEIIAARKLTTKIMYDDDDSPFGTIVGDNSVPLIADALREERERGDSMRARPRGSRTRAMKRYAQEMMDALEVVDPVSDVGTAGRMIAKVHAERVSTTFDDQIARMHQRHLVDIALLALNELITHQNRMYINDLMKMHGGDEE